MTSKRKGSFADLIIITVVLFAVSIAFFFTNRFGVSMMQELNASEEHESAKEVLTYSSEKYPSTLETIFVCAVFAAGIGAVVTAFLIRTHPVMYIVFFAVLIVIIIVSPELSNFHQDLVADSDFEGVGQSMPISTWIMLQYPKVMLVFSFIVAVVLYAKGGD